MYGAAYLETDCKALYKHTQRQTLNNQQPLSSLQVCAAEFEMGVE